MAARVAVDEVKEIIDIGASTTDAMVTVFIKSATILVDKIETDGGLDDADHLKEIERWLAAHFVAIRDKRTSSEGAGKVSQSFQHSLGLNFNVTMYGQQALALDTTGILAAQQKQEGRIVATVTAYGPVSDDDIDDAY